MNGTRHRQGDETYSTGSGQALADYGYSLDKAGNVKVVTETLVALQVIPAGSYPESGGQVVLEADPGIPTSGATHTWLTATTQSGYTGGIG